MMLLSLASVSHGVLYFASSCVDLLSVASSFVGNVVVVGRKLKFFRVERRGRELRDLRWTGRVESARLPDGIGPGSVYS